MRWWYLLLCWALTEARRHKLPPNVTLGTAPQHTDSGRWGPWSPASDCSRSCGGGVASQSRVCLDLSDGEPTCRGAFKRYFSCNVHDCPEGSPDFRADQCSRYDPVPFEGKFYTWIPYTKATNPCELTCMPQGEGFYYRQARSVIDGTSCGDRRVCVENSCVPIGCDGQLGSELEEDKCHECGGRGRNCHTILGTYTEDNLQVGYNDILLVPAGATNLVVKERAPSPNYLAVRNLTGHFYLNGRWRLDLPRELHFAGTTFRYDRPAERLEAPGPTTESLFIALLYQTQNTGVDYEYSVPREVHVSANGTYSWTTDSELGPCSASCGRGVHEQRVRCIETTGAREVSSHLCDPRERPSTSAPCPDLKPCPAKWVVKGPWGPCQDGRQERTLQCDGEDCSHVPRPENPSRSCELEFGPWSECSGPCGSQRRQARGGGAVQERACRTEACAAEWLTGEWGGCPECGLLESRTVACADAKGRPLPTDELCDPTRRPPNTRPCPGCQGPRWRVSPWSECSASCGPVGVQTREVSCVSSDCQGEVPVSQRPCHPAPPPCPPLWLTGPWDKCSSSCGGGRRLRLVVCHDAGSLTAPDLCDPVTRPFGEEACNMLPCDEDEVMVVGRSCQHSPHGCCPDGLTPAGPHGCPDTLGSPANCTQAEFGCCDDGVTPAAGPFRRGCPRAQREQAVGSGDAEVEGSGDDCQPHGCCPDGVTPALGPDNLACCRASLYGCCPDNKTEALGPAAKGCPCTSHPHGCCSDGRTPAHGPGGKGCECHATKYGCCPDKYTAARGPDMEGCPCSTHVYGCCPDGKTLAQGEELKGCPCSTHSYGCCPDGLSIAHGPDMEGCPCSSHTYGCCPDGVSIAHGPDMEGCSCSAHTYGCCPDGLSIAHGPDMEGCPCSAHTYGCCPDGLSIAHGPDMEGCPCSAHTYGCCPDGKTAAKGPEQAGCPCEAHPYGCCPDEKTPAQGPDMEGCPCYAHRHGCCPDGKTASKGPELEGCPCSSHTYGCCPDGKTPAQGPDQEGCPCSAHAHGCCPDGKTSAKGPELEGCPCSSHIYGCCPDGKTPAQGPEMEGCLCASFPHGCCADGKTPAKGPEMQGCPCKATPHGCCPDGRTPATGPSYAGCGCMVSEFGCCPDGATPAQGPRYDGCPCASSPYGCCPDGVSIAYGPNFEECGESAAEVLTSVGDVCSLDKERGPCHNYTVKWYFDMAYGGCSRFWYGGCDGNGNRFATLEACEQACVAPEGAEVCKLPKVAGPCEGQYPSWYFDPTSRTCRHFVYGGCLGNNNRFSSRQTCEEACVFHDVADPCDQPKVTGPCRGHFPRWYYDRVRSECRPFTYGGCKGNDNNFVTEEACVQQCAVATTHSKDVCALPRDPGPCQDALPRWYHDTAASTCLQFKYSGCEGNANRFKSRERCEATCVAGSSNRCQLPGEPGPCAKALPRWHFDASLGRCRPFIYGGCKGNANRFETRQECEGACAPTQLPPSDQAACELPQEIGNCYHFQERWFHAGEGRCQQFYYSGCGGNANNFASHHECSALCGDSGEEFRVDQCFLALEAGDTACDGRDLRWFYDRSDGVCKEFYFTGCGGNANRFESRRECEGKCGPAQDVCGLPAAAGACSGSFLQWHFDGHVCREFVYTGCHGNANRFDSRQACEQRCGGRTTTALATTGDVCQEPEDPGPCLGQLPQWFYDSAQRQCRTFLYGGCEGNSNRFETRQDCEQRCIRPEKSKRKKEEHLGNIGVCREPVALGSCLQPQSRWYYDPALLRCRTFTYSGCGGNKNRFKTFETCMRFCSGIKPGRSSECPQCDQSLHCEFGLLAEPADGCPSCRCAPDPCLACPNGTWCELERRNDTEPVTATCKPSWETREAESGENVTLECPFSGEITWSRDSALLSTGGPRLHLTVVEVEDSGVYSCRRHEGPSYNFNLTVYRKLEVKVPEGEVVLGTAAEIRCEGTTSPVTWLHNGTHISEEPSKPKLRIAAVQAQDAGLYQCSEGGRVSAPSELRVKEIPVPANCTDLPHFANCELIVRASFCKNVYYAKFCCRTCTLAGQL